ncbi:class I glutamine amidotransferase-like protein [Crucibulum laeve]|uniref:Class I glutamine amidotransferase-like protein n=1 Tax=Crucibulum laeve TaxID=68775 RepID=A0A5C3LX88_9AGAR|nr:class I glutamine amidotransferase-like protein [Crucibulum laeve]
MSSNPSKPISLALLVCGALQGKVYAENGDYLAVFSRFLDASLPDASSSPSSSSIKFTLDPYDVVESMTYPTDAQLDTYDGLLITGSAASAYENVEWINRLTAFVKHVADEKPHVKLIGICFGHQIIARALGGECVPNGGRWEVGPTPIELTDIGKQIFGVESLNIQEMHRDHVPEVPPTFQLLGSTAVTPNQGMVRFYSPSPTSSSSSPQTTPSPTSLSQIHILTVQGHPEFTKSIVSGIVKQRTYSGVIDSEAAEDAERRKDWRNDGVGVLGKAVWGVLGVGA